MGDSLPTLFCATDTGRPYLLEEMTDGGFRIRCVISHITNQLLYCTHTLSPNPLIYQVKLKYVYLKKLGGVHFMCIHYTHNPSLVPFYIGRSISADVGPPNVGPLVEYYRSLSLDRYDIRTDPNAAVYLWDKLDTLPTTDNTTCMIGLDINYRIKEVKCRMFRLEMRSSLVPTQSAYRLINHIVRYTPTRSELTTMIDQEEDLNIDLTKYRTIICTDAYTFRLLRNTNATNPSMFSESPCDRIPFLGDEVFNGINNGYAFGYIMGVGPTNIPTQFNRIYYEDVLNGIIPQGNVRDSNGVMVTTYTSGVYKNKNIYALSFDNRAPPTPQPLYGRFFYTLDKSNDPRHIHVEYKPRVAKVVDPSVTYPHCNNSTIPNWPSLLDNVRDANPKRFQIVNQRYCAY